MCEGIRTIYVRTYFISTIMVGPTILLQLFRTKSLPARDPPTLSERLNPVQGAAFDEGETRASRCMEGTRVEVIGKIKKWAKGDSKDPICWFHGAAGFGKSAIARTTAGYCLKKKKLVGSFFFLRGSGDRSKISGLIPTLAFHLSQSVPDTKPFIEKRLREEPNILLQPAAYQFQKLLVDTYRSAKRWQLRFNDSEPVIIIDALDE